MRRLAILHFNPIELYPPALNWLNFLAAGKSRESRVRVYTLRRSGKSQQLNSGSEEIKIYRPASAGKKGIPAYFNYLRYYIVTLLQLIRWRPDVVLYYETLSCLPAIFYKKYINSKARIFIHYHEYTSPGEYDRSGPLLRRAHQQEKKLYPFAEWISHTNEDRIALFKKDQEGINLPPVCALPNYPPFSWIRPGSPAKDFGIPVRLVYVGALSLDTMYTRELTEWIIGQKGKVSWDIYSDNITAEAKAWLLSQDSRFVRFREAVDYYQLPEILTKYDIGVILYKGHIPNYVYNAPNKLFEYMACGLDIWFPDVMTGSLPFVTKGVYPRVVAMNFSNLQQIDLAVLSGRTGLSYDSSPFYCEQVYDRLMSKIS